MFIIFKSSLFINDLSKNKQQKNYGMERISEIIEKLVIKYKMRIAFKNKKKAKIILSSKKVKQFSKISLFKENLYIYLLRKYIYRILNKFLKDSKLSELIKEEILKAPRGTFKEFLELYNELTQEIQKTYNRDSVYIDYIFA